MTDLSADAFIQKLKWLFSPSATEIHYAGNPITDAIKACKQRDAARDAKLRAELVPEGYVVVPIEPTVVQNNAGVDCDDLRTGFETVKHIYRHMIEAAPKPTDKQEI